MRILVYGAGVLGSLYAARLKDSGNDVTILARGARVEEIRQNGIILEDERSGARTATQVQVIDHLDPVDAYDLVLVVVRKNQVAHLLPALAGNHHTPNVLFLVNNAAGPHEMIQALGSQRVLLGFPGGGGGKEGPVIRYMLTRTTLGELDGSLSPRLLEIGRMLKEAGWPVVYSSNIDAWLKTHVAVVAPIANALYLAGGDNYRLARTRDGVVLLTRGVREGLQVLQAHGIPVTPPTLRYMLWLPEPVLVAILQKLLATHLAELGLARHAIHARDEMATLSAEFRTLAHSTSIPTPTLDHLRLYADPDHPTLPEGKANLPMDWKGIWAALAWMAVIILFIRWLFRRK